ncbi:MAG: nitrogen regulation protein NR(I) [Hyphomicrobiales bacterium]
MAGETILVADDDAAIRTILDQALTRAGYQVRLTGTAGTLWRWASQGEGDLIITDVVMPDDNAFNLLPRIKNVRPDVPILVMSAQNTFMTAITASERGAYDYLPKPFDLRELVEIVGRALSERSTGVQIDAHQPAGEDIPLVGRSSAMQEIYRVLARLMQNDLTVLIEGESGTGKELVARALHDYGKRKGGPFVAINMAAIPRDLIEAELFGYEKGAFTGANSRGSGRFEQAEGGTLFLDEIGDMPMDAQTRLLRVLQQGEYMTVGGRKSIRTDVRIIAATNKGLHALIGEGRFREDLYYRLNVIPIRLPPLRDRLDDVDDLVRHFFAQAAKEGLGMKQIDSAALTRMKQHNWPGNVRELENVVRRLAALYPQDIITHNIVDHELGRVDANSNEEPFTNQPLDMSLLVESLVKTAFSETDSDRGPDQLYHSILHRMEKPLISATLAHTGGNQIKAADILGLNRNTLRKKIKELDVKIIKSV